MIGLKLITDIEQIAGIDAEFRDLAARLELGLGELATGGLGGVLGLGEARTELNGGVAVLLLRAGGHDGATVELQNRNRDMGAVC